MFYRNLREKLRSNFLRLRTLYLRGMWKHDLHHTSIISYGAFLDRSNPRGIIIGPYTIITKGSIILSHDHTTSKFLTTKIGKNCFIGVNSIILPGVTIGDYCVIGAGSVVTRSVTSNSLVVGNPAIKIDTITTSKYGRIIKRNK